MGTKTCVLHNQAEMRGRGGGRRRDESDRETGECLSDRQHHCVFDGSD